MRRRRGAPLTGHIPPVTPAFPIRLLALDLDGTLVGDDGILGPETRRTVREALRRGVEVVLVSGRMPSSLRGYAEALGLRGPVVGHHGALIRLLPAPGEPGPGRLLKHRPLPAATARRLVAWARGRGFDVHANHLERLILPAGHPRAEDYSAFLGAKAILVPDLEAALSHPVSKLLAVGDREEVQKALAEATATFAGQATATISHPGFLEFVALGVSKGAAVRWLARRLGIPLSQVLAAGDQLNDLSMLQVVGHPAAVVTAPPEVQLAARYLVAPASEEGIAALLEAVVLPPPDEAARRGGTLASPAGPSQG